MISRHAHAFTPAILAMVAAVFTLTQARPSAVSGVAETRKAVPSFAMTDAAGKAVKLSEYRGKVVALNFWATWCTGCKAEIPYFIEFDTKYRAKGLATLGVSLDDDGWKTVKPYVASHPISYRLAFAPFDVIEKPLGLDPALPATLLIDRQGRIADTHTGVIDKAAFEKQILALLAETAR